MLTQQSNPDRNPFSVDPESDVPIGVQLSWRLRTLILSGRLAADAALPSVRQMAKWADVNPNTVRAVYDSLQEEGLVSGRQGKGTFVAHGAVAKPELESIALDAVRRGQESGMGPRDLAIAVMACADMLDAEDDPLPPTDPPAHDADSETLEIRHELRRQIAQLESELAPYIRDLPPGDMPTAPGWAEGHVSGVEELEQTRDILFAKLFKAREAAIARARIEAEARSDQAPASTPGPLARAMSWWGDAIDQRPKRRQGAG
jgi:DNA-binding transcriptional regulator YhcF (GntR family)